MHDGANWSTCREATSSSTQRVLAQELCSHKGCPLIRCQLGSITHVVPIVANRRYLIVHNFYGGWAIDEIVGCGVYEQIHS